ncbi:MAG: regulatory protein RecX [Bacteroidales bacterium]|nr:regulatory protein RecX [Bacteroidales bacterium]
MTPEQTIMLEKARQYCDYEERCIQDVKNKLSQWSVQSELIDKIVIQLENENYLDEDRFVRAFALGKLRINKWGRNKILYALRSKNIPDLIIQIGLEELDSEEYIQILKKVLSSKKINESDPYKYNAKLAQYAIQKGFQPSLVWQIINEKI